MYYKMDCRVEAVASSPCDLQVRVDGGGPYPVHVVYYVSLTTESGARAAAVEMQRHVAVHRARDVQAAEIARVQALIVARDYHADQLAVVQRRLGVEGGVRV
jgi:hypothetical protein